MCGWQERGAQVLGQAGREAVPAGEVLQVESFQQGHEGLPVLQTLGADGLRYTPHFLFGYDLEIELGIVSTLQIRKLTL